MKQEEFALALNALLPGCDPETAREREAAFLSAAEDGFAIYHLSGADPQSCVPLARLEKEGKSPLDGGYNLVHVVYTEPGGDDYATLEACKATGVLTPGGIMAFKQNGAVTSWYMDQLAYTQMPGLLKNVLKAAEIGTEQNYNQIDGIINNETPKPSLRDSLKQRQREIEAAQPVDVPGKHHQRQER